MENVYIIAEAGVNHNGSISIARNLIDAANKAGADAVKFQTFTAKELCSKFAPKASYQKIKDSTESQYEMLKQLELDLATHQALIAHASSKGIDFLSSPFDLNSIDLLNNLGLETIKIPSGEITNLPYLEKIGSLRRQIILSTGMANLKEVEDAIFILKKAGTKAKKIALLHCCSEYPAPFEAVNLNVISTLKKQFHDHTIGYSDHTVGIHTPVAAVAMGAMIIEKHFTLDKTLPGPDHSASLDPEDLKGMVRAIRDIEKAFGSGIKEPSPAEIRNRECVRKSIVASKNIKKGEKFSHLNITLKRPGDGLSPMEWYNVIGKRAVKDFCLDEKISI